MNREEKELLLKDLCCRLPYKTKISRLNDYINQMEAIELNAFHLDSIGFEIEYRGVKPYLRPMPSMTNEEKEALLNLLFDKEARIFYIDEEGQIDGKTTDLMKEGINYPSFCPINITMYIDFLNAHHFDYRGLIEKGLALEAPEGMYK